MSRLEMVSLVVGSVVIMGIIGADVINDRLVKKLKNK